MENKFHFAKEIIYQAGAFLREHLYDDLDVSQKTSATDLVTQMDRKVQDDLVAKILARYPQDAILAEENGLRHNITDGNVWVIDPTLTSTVTTGNFLLLRTGLFKIFSWLLMPVCCKPMIGGWQTWLGSV